MIMHLRNLDLKMRISMRCGRKKCQVIFIVQFRWKDNSLMCLIVYDDAEVNELLSKRNTFVLKMDEEAELANLKPKQE